MIVVVFVISSFLMRFPEHDGGLDYDNACAFLETKVQSMKMTHVEKYIYTVSVSAFDTDMMDRALEMSINASQNIHQVSHIISEVEGK